MATKEKSAQPVESVESVESMQPIQDEFCSPTFVNKAARLPLLQPLRGATPQACCYFVSLKNAALAGWQATDIPIVDYTFEGTGEVEQGYAFKELRMLACPKSPLMMYDKAATEAAKSWVLVGEYDKDLKSENVASVRFYHVILVDKDNKPLHSIPLLYAAKGFNQFSFSKAWEDFCKAINFCHAMANGIPPLDKTNEFYSLCVFAFKVKRELVGTTKKSQACLVGDWEKPTPDNWKNYFVGYNQQLKQNTWGLLMPSVKLALPGISMDEEPTTPALPLPATAEEYEAQRKQLKSAEVSPF